MAAAPAMAAEGKKLSFAKVAASATHESVLISAAPRGALQAKSRRDYQPPSGAAARPRGLIPMHISGAASMAAAPAMPPAQPVSARAARTEPPDESKLVAGMADLRLENRMPSVMLNGGASASADQSAKAGTSQTPSDEASLKADSNSELGTKPPSIDDKSIISGTTFAMDEKESLRPDDSASVKAAAEDDDAFSVRGSLLANSRMGSDVAARAQRIQIGDMPPRGISQALPELHPQGVDTPQSSSSEQQPVGLVRMPFAAATTAPEGMNGGYRQNPDEKLLEAMLSPKDRLFLLRLEKEVIEFVQDSKEPFMDLPPSNSFCRMLTHKLAEYYHMTHSFEAVAGAVRIFRTPFRRVPPPLSSFATASISNGSTPPPALLPKKIMRRGEDGELATASAGPSKPTSEVGSDVKDRPPLAKEKLSREEREEAYNRARERIFGNSGAADSSVPDTEDGAGVSRASSVSAKDRSNLGKKGRKRRDSESFDSRSHYTPFYGHPQQATWASPQYIPVGVPPPPFNGQPVAQQPYANTMQQPVYAPPNQPYPTMMAGNGFPAPVNGIAQYPPPTQPRYAGPNGLAPLGQYGPVQPQAGPPPPSWQPGFNQGPPFQPRAAQAPQVAIPPQVGIPPQAGIPLQVNIPQPAGIPPQAGMPPQAAIPQQAGIPTQAGVPHHVGIPYAYGQLPVNVNPSDPKSQHPIPGSYAGKPARHGFNPRTQSFVPGSGMTSGISPGMSPVQTAAGPVSYSAVNPLPGPPPLSQSPMSFNGYQQAVPLPHQYANSGGDFGMMRQGSNNSLSPYPPPPTQPQAYQGPPPPLGPALSHLPHNPGRHIPTKPQGHGKSVGQQFSNLPKYGNPATLPQKPST